MGKKAKSPAEETVEEREPFVPDLEFHAELKSYKLEGGEGEEEKRVIEGYASTEDLDRGNEVTHKEAFKKSLGKFLSKNPLLTYMHSWDQPIGIIEDAEIDGKGLKVRAVIAKNDPIADRVWNLIEQKVLRAFSFGYKIINADYEKAGDKTIKHIRDLELLEVAVVSIPMNRNTFFSVSKALQYGTDQVNLEQPDKTHVEEGKREPEVEKEPEEKVELTAEELSAQQVLKFESFVSEVKAGRVLSTKNRTAIVAALEALTAVLEADAPKAKPEPEKSAPKQQVPIKAIHGMINSIANVVKDEIEFQKDMEGSLK